MAAWIRRLVMGLLVGTLGVLASWTPWGSEWEKGLGLSWLFQLRGATAPPVNVMVVAIDKLSSDELGFPPMPDRWPRGTHARLIEKLSNAGAHAIAFDLRFDVPGAVPEDDAKLAAAMRAAGNVVVVERLDRIPLAGRSQSMHFSGSMETSAALLPEIADAAAARAPFPLPRAARVNEYWTFRPDAGDTPTLPVTMVQLVALKAYEDFVRLLHRTSPAHARSVPAHRDAVVIDDLILTLRGLFSGDPGIVRRMTDALDHDPDISVRNRHLIRALLNLYASDELHYLDFYGPPRTVPTVPYHVALGDAAGASPGVADFAGKAVFVGYSAATQPEQDRVRDDYHTVFSRTDGLYISGVEIAATAFANLMDGRAIRPLSFSSRLALVFAWGFVLAGTYGIRRRPGAFALDAVFVIATLAWVAVYVGIARHRFAADGTWLPLVIPLLLQVPLAVFGVVLLRYYDAWQERKAFKAAVGKFLPERVLAEISRSTDAAVPDNQLIHGVCLATDAEMYTTLAERMEPARLGVLMNDYYAVLFEPVERHGGIVSDVVGDAMLAIWSSAAADAAVRRRACLACLDIAAALERFNRAPGRPPLHTRIGLHSGEMLLGRVGALQHYEYRAVGDMVNTSNRIQGLNKHLGTRLLVSESVVAGLDDFVARPLGSFLLAGKTSPVRVLELLARREDASAAQLWLCDVFARAVRDYESQAWPQGCEKFAEILEAVPGDGPARFYLERCQDYRAAAPVGPWDASIRIAAK